MTNVAGALEVLGKGLFEVGKVKLNREDDEMAYMRQQALQELGIKAQKEMQEANQTFVKGENQANRAADAESRAIEMADRRGNLYVSEDLASKRQAQSDARADARLSRTEAFTLARDKAGSLTEIRTAFAASMKSIESESRDLAKERRGYIAAAQRDGVDPDPAMLQDLDERVNGLQLEASELRKSQTASIAAFSGIQPEPDPEAPMGSDERTRRMSRFPSHVGEKEAQAEQKPRSATGQKAPTMQPAAQPAVQPTTTAEPAPVNQEALPWAERKSGTDAINASIATGTKDLFTGPQNDRIGTRAAPIPGSRGMSTGTKDGAGFAIDTSRPEIKNPDGSISTESTITVGFGSRYYNIPTIWDGKRVDKKVAIARAREAIRRGETFPNFGSQQEAVNQAQARSAEIGRVRGIEG